MAIPNYQAMIHPLLLQVSDGKEYSLKELIGKLADHFQLTEAELLQRSSNNKAYTFAYRLAWARTHLVKAKLLDSTRRGYLQISSRGIDLLKQSPEKIDSKFLMRFSEFREFMGKEKLSQDMPIASESDDNVSEQTPQELISSAYHGLRRNLASELLETIKGCSPAFFERLVVDLLVKMGYGGTRQDAGRAIGRSGDEGIDGIINEDRLGLDVVYIQAKRWEGNIGRPEIQKFVGALAGQSARKGIFITTSDFAPSAREYVRNANQYKIVLIDGKMLGELMIDYNVGVTVQERYEIKRIDSDYFSEE